LGERGQYRATLRFAFRTGPSGLQASQILLRPIKGIAHCLNLGIQSAALRTLEQEKSAFAAGPARFGRLSVEVRLLTVQLIFELPDATRIRAATVERAQLRFETRACRILDWLLLWDGRRGGRLLCDNCSP
jgi:hypothetical protein